MLLAFQLCESVQVFSQEAFVTYMFLLSRKFFLLKMRYVSVGNDTPSGDRFVD